MRMRLGLVCLLAAVLASQLTHAATGGRVNLARKYKAGSIFFVRVEMDILIFNGDDSDTDTQKEEEKILVKTVARDGTVWLAKVVDVHLDLGRSVLVKADKLGRVLSVQVSNSDAGETLLPASPDFALVEQMREVLLPGRLVRVGETWETRVENFKVKGDKFLVRTTLLGPERDGARRLWHVKQTAAMLEGSETNSDVAVCRADFWLDADTNMITRSIVRIENSSGNVTIRTKAAEGPE